MKITEDGDEDEEDSLSPKNKKARNGWRALIAGVSMHAGQSERTPAIAVSY